MKKKVAQHLEREIQRVCDHYSKVRQRNPSGTTFKKRGVQPLSEDTALVTFEKSDKKFALAFFYYYEWGQHRTGTWKYLFMTDSHVLGMKRLAELNTMLEIEARNYAISIQEADEMPGMQQHETDEN